MTKPKRGFALSPAAAALVGESKVVTAGDLPVVPPQGGETPVTPQPSATPPAEPAAPEAPPAPPAAAPAQPAAEPVKAAPAPAPAVETPPAPAKKPWEVCDTAPTGLNFKPEADLHAKMEWVCDNVPKMNRSRILRDGAMLLCDQLIAKYGKELA